MKYLKFRIFFFKNLFKNIIKQMFEREFKKEKNLEMIKK